jgi:hypothetical protein
MHVSKHWSSETILTDKVLAKHPLSLKGDEI